MDKECVKELENICANFMGIITGILLQLPESSKINIEFLFKEYIKEYNEIIKKCEEKNDGV
jgi:hypothetical protein